MKRATAFAAGVMAGATLAGALAHAAGSLSLQVAPAAIRLVIDGREVPGSPPGQFDNGTRTVPLALMYEGTTYVPVRLIGEALGRRVAWDPATRTITLSLIEGGGGGSPPPARTGTPVPFEAVAVSQAPAEVQTWVRNSLAAESSQTYTTGGRTYILVTRGEKPTGGYGVSIVRIVDQGEAIVVEVRYTDPRPGQMVPQVITYPYALVSTPALTKPVRFEQAPPA